MNIIHLSRLYCPHVGGVERHVQFLNRELLEQGHTILVVTEQHDPSLPLVESHEGVEIWRIPHSHLSSKKKLWAWMWSKRERFLRADIVHAHDVLWWFWPIKLAHPTTSVFTTFHGYEGSEPPGWRAKAHRKFNEMLSKKTICIGEFMKHWYGADPDLILYGAADMEPQESRADNTAVYLGRLSADAGIMTYLKMLAEMKEPLSLSVYGEGEQKEQAARYAVAHRLQVRFGGWIDNISEALANHRYAFVSRYLAILEAMQSKRLVVAVYNNAIKRDYLLCHPQRENMIIAGSGKEGREKLDALSEKDEKEMIHRAYLWAKEQTFSTLAKRYLDLWTG